MPVVWHRAGGRISFQLIAAAHTDLSNWSKQVHHPKFKCNEKDQSATRARLRNKMVFFMRRKTMHHRKKSVVTDEFFFHLQSLSIWEHTEKILCANCESPSQQSRIEERDKREKMEHNNWTMKDAGAKIIEGNTPIRCVCAFEHTIISRRARAPALENTKF